MESFVYTVPELGLRHGSTAIVVVHERVTATKLRI
jgi:hypothetical protein